MAPATIPTAAYKRLSPRPDGAYELGLDRQQSEIDRVAKYRNLSVVETFVDEDRSAFKGKRPAYEAMMAKVRAGQVEAVVAYDIDRLYRRPRELEDLIDLAEGGVLVVTAQGDIDLTTSNGRAMARVVVAMASKSSEDESRRMKLKHAELAKHGKTAGGKRPFGYKADRVSIDRREAKLIRQAADRILAGGSLRSIVNEWNAAGIPTANGAEWRHFTLKWILTSARIAGLRAHNGTTVGKADWEPIITEAEHLRLRAILNDPARRPSNSGNARKYLLTGFATCGAPSADGGVCGHRLVARPRGDGERSMVCASDFGGCGKIRALAEPLEVEVARRLFVVVDSPATAKAYARSERGSKRDGLEDQLTAQEGSLRQLTNDHYVDRLVGRDDYLSAKAALEERIAETNALLASSTTTHRAGAEYIGRGDALRKDWDGMALDRQRSILDAFVVSVVVSPAVKGRNTFDPKRVAVTWRW
jgi:site-specific DNA recombinase